MTLLSQKTFRLLGVSILFLGIILPNQAYSEPRPRTVTFDAISNFAAAGIAAYRSWLQANPNPVPGGPGAEAAAALGEIAAGLGVTVDFLITNWATVGPCVQSGILQARVAVAGAGPAAQCGVYVLGRSAAYIPHVALLVTALGLTAITINQLQIAAHAAEGNWQAAQWQMRYGMGRVMRGRDRVDYLLLPSLVAGRNITIRGPGVGEVSERLLQAYIIAAFQAQGGVSSNTARSALAHLSNIIGISEEEPPERSRR